MLEEKSFIDSINIKPDGQMEVRRAQVILKDGVEIARNLHRWVVEPDQDAALIEDERLKKVCSSVWDKDTIENYKQQKKKKEEEKRDRA